MPAQSSDRPNILLILADQMTPLLTGPYGDPVAITPNLNRLADEGVTFDAAYTACPLCAPARASLVCGKQISEIGVWDNAAPFDADAPTYNHYLSTAGYDTVTSGKMHFVGPDQLHGLNRRLTTDIYPSSMAWLPTAKRAPDVRELDRRSHAQNYALPKIGVRPWTRFLAYDTETQFRALEYLRDQPQDPFHLCVSFHCPHDPHWITQELWDLYEGKEIPIPEYPENMEETYSAMDRWLNAYHGTDRFDIKDPESLRTLRRIYYGLVTWIDRLVGQLLQTLEDQGLADNTIVAFSADHGDMLASKNMVQKRSFYEMSSRVPMFMRFPDGYQAGRRVETPVSLIDLAPTFLEVAGVDDYLAMDGDSLLPLIEREAPDRTVYSESHTNGVYATCFMARQGRYKYIYINGEEDQLFDLENDPGEWHSLIGDPAYGEVAAALRAQILSRFDPDAIESRLQTSLDRRHVVRQANLANDVHWDYFPQFDATSQYVR